MSRGRSLYVLMITLAMALSASASARADSPTTYTLDNGLTVVLRPLPAAKHVAVVVLFDIGGNHDPVGKSGMAHLLEHVYLTAAAGDTPMRSMEQLQQQYAAGCNGQTGFDYTVISGVVEPGELDNELKDAAARMDRLQITEADLRREVPRLLNEVSNMYGRIPSLAGLNHARARLHPTAGGGRHAGAPEHVKTIRPEDLRRHWQDYYKPRNAILAVAGPFDLDKTRQLIARQFGPISAGKPAPEQPRRPSPKLGTSERIRVKPIVPGATGVVSVGYAAPRPGSKDYAAYLIVASRLMNAAFQETQRGGRPGSVQPIYCPPLDDPSTIALQAPLPPNKDPKAVAKEIDDRLQAALSPTVTAEDKARVANMMFMLGTLDVPEFVWTQNPYGAAFSLARRHQLRLKGNRLRRSIAHLAPADMRRLAKHVFSPRRRVVQIVEVSP